MDKIRILFVSANPHEKGALRLGEEVRVIEESIFRSQARDIFELTFQPALHASDLQRALMRFRPQIVHFSGHGSLSKDIVLEDDIGRSNTLTSQAIVSIFSLFRDDVKVVFLDACFTQRQAKAINSVIDYTLGTDKKMGAPASTVFAAAFYQALGFGRPVEVAFESANAEINLRSISGSVTPTLLVRHGVDVKEPLLSLLERSDREEGNTLTRAFERVAAGEANKEERSLVRRALIEGSLTLEQVDPSGTGEVAKDEVSRVGTKEDIRNTQVEVSAPLYEKIQREVFPTPRGLPPPLPGLVFVGREDSLTEVKRLIGVGQSKSQKNSVTVVRGWPGVGKTTLVSVVAHDPEVIEAFPDGVLWTALEQKPELMSKIALWTRALGTDDLLNIPTVTEATERLGLLLRDKRMLLVIDDVWDVDDARPFLQAASGSKCAVLATTRLTGVAEALVSLNQLWSPAASVYVLPILAEDDALTLLRYLAPEVVALHPEACRELLRDLECLPLAIHVAGGLLNEKLRTNVADLSEWIRKAAILEAEPSPLDRAEGAAIPTVRALLLRSTDLLDEETRACFAYLGVFAPKPATFDMEALKAVWLIDDPKPVIRKLVSFGLLEPVGSDRFQMHALLAQHANSLLT